MLLFLVKYYSSITGVFKVCLHKLVPLNDTKGKKLGAAKYGERISIPCEVSVSLNIWWWSSVVALVVHTAEAICYLCDLSLDITFIIFKILGFSYLFWCDSAPDCVFKGMKLMLQYSSWIYRTPNSAVLPIDETIYVKMCFIGLN